ncbi:MAG: family protein phosphatase [Miltoncostaeaceae bacterium]|nr:family protein phosphatase [Miltoncostaeaceae bacterium]
MSRPLALVEVTGLTDTGRVRSHNEDRSLAEPSLIAVADGMGGAKAGEVAAEVAVKAIAELRRPPSAAQVRDAIVRANAEIRRMAERDPEKSGMGTTMTAAVLDDGKLGVVHVGDSRAYLWRGRQLRQLTDDHSVVAEMVRRGSLAPEEAEAHPHRNVITRALGAEASVRVDEVSEELREGDIVLVCSDGLSSYVPDGRIAGELVEAKSLEEAARRLVNAANAAGGADNVTVVLARVGPADEAPSAEAAGAAGEPGEEGADTAEIPVLGGMRGRAAQAAADGPAARPARVLEPVDRRRARRKRPIVIGIVVVLAATAAALTWVGSRTYSLAETDDGTVAVEHGLPWSALGLDLAQPWQGTGVPADVAREGSPGALEGGWHGQGEAVQIAAGLVWRLGVPELRPLAPPGTELETEGPTGPADTGGSATG